MSSLYSLDNQQPPMWCIKAKAPNVWHIFPPRLFRWYWEADVNRYLKRTQ